MRIIEVVAGRVDGLRRTRLYRKALNMYMWVHSFLLGATRASLFLSIALAAALFARPTAAIQFAGKVVGVTDGDTITVLVERRAIKVRLAQIDTPEKGQPHGSRAKKALSDLVFGKVTTVREQVRDRYGRTVGRVYVDGHDVNAEMVRGGHAWVYQQYATDHSLYGLEADAKAAQRGLWASPEAKRVPPWEWRHGGNQLAQAAPVERTAAACGSKRYCREMASCEEARHYLSACELTRLDGDGDGVPCEALC